MFQGYKKNETCLFHDQKPLPFYTEKVRSLIFAPLILNMKTTRSKWKLLLLLAAPLFMFGICSPDDDLPTPNTDEFITWQIPGRSGNVTTPPDNIGMGYYQSSFTAIGGSNTSNGSNFYAAFAGPQAPGNYPTMHVAVYVNGQYY